MADSVEHQILKRLYGLKWTTTSEGSQKRGRIPIYEKSYDHCHLHFGVLVDVINKPSNYTKDKLPEGVLLYTQELIKTEDSINTEKYSFWQVADALELLLLNKHVREDYPLIEGKFNGRRIFLEDTGALAYMNKFYLKETETGEIDEIKNTTARIELSLKKNWLRNEIIKYSITTVVGAIIGAVIALLASQWGQKSKEQLNNQLQITADTIIVKSSDPKN